MILPLNAQGFVTQRNRHVVGCERKWYEAFNVFHSDIRLIWLYFLLKDLSNPPNHLYIYLCSVNSIFVSPDLAGKTHRDHFVPCSSCCLLLSVVKRVNIWLYLPHALMGFNQSWVIDATWEPSFVDEVKSRISRLKVIWGQVVRWKWLHLKSWSSIWTKLCLLI